MRLIASVRVQNDGQPSNLSSDFPLGSRKFISEYIHLLIYLCRVLREESDQSRYMPVILFSILKKVGGYSLCCPPQAE